jgi:hypothetical protein
MENAAIRCVFYGSLVELLPGKKGTTEIFYPLRRRAAIKDIIESLAIPHTEVGKIEKEGVRLGFHHIAVAEEQFHIFPFDSETPILQPTVLRPIPFSSISFMVDDTVRRLGRNMRMAGLDTAVAPPGRLTEIAHLATFQERILVSRNRDLLKCKDVLFGQLIRSEDHIIQLREVLRRYIFVEKLQLLSRCLEFNTVLQPVKKEDVLHRLEPLTRKYYFIFKKCPGCGKIYWHGSHVEKMEKLIAAAGRQGTL